MRRFVALLLMLSLTLMLGAVTTTVCAADEDWDAIIAAAKKEGLLVIYNPSSRMKLPKVLPLYGIEIQWPK